MAKMNRLGKHATTISNNKDYFIVTYHYTDIVSFNSHEIKLKTGGWRTATTKTRMNQASNQFNLGFRVFQKCGDWFVTDNLGTHPFNDHELILIRTTNL